MHGVIYVMSAFNERSFNEFVNVLGERDRSALDLRLNALLLNAFILAFVSAVLKSFHKYARRPEPSKRNPSENTL